MKESKKLPTKKQVEELMKEDAERELDKSDEYFYIEEKEVKHG